MKIRFSHLKDFAPLLRHFCAKSQFFYLRCWLGLLLIVPALHAQLPGKFDADYLGTSAGPGAINGVTMQPDGKALVAGDFPTINGIARPYLARLEANGSLDTSFSPSLNGAVGKAVVQPNGQILIYGAFTQVGGLSRVALARVNANGSVDATFNPVLNGSVHVVAVQSDGKILIGGNFTTVGGITRNRLARLNANGSLESGFNPNVNGTVECIALQQDGKIVLGGEFTQVSSTTRNHLARLATDGTLEAGVNFNPNVDDNIYALAVQADGKILLSGAFQNVGSTVRHYVARINGNGTVDAGFNPDLDGPAVRIAVEADGDVLLGGTFQTVGNTINNLSYPFLTRLSSSGVPYPVYNPFQSFLTITDTAQIRDFAVLPNGRVLAVGIKYYGIFANDNYPILEQIFDFAAGSVLTKPNASHLLWTRSDSAPEVSQVTFEQSIDGGLTWTALPTVFRFGNTANWQLTGLNLPASVSIRARGRLTDGTSGMLEQITDFGADGSLASSYDPDVAGTVYGTCQQVDGKTLVAGNFTSVGGLLRANLARLETGGTVEGGFHVDTNDAVRSLAVLKGEKFLLGGDFTHVGDGDNYYAARVRNTGVQENYAFNPLLNGPVRCLLERDWGEDYVMGGAFTLLKGATVANLVRTDAAAALKTYFNPQINGTVNTMAVQADHTILVGGTFTAAGTNTRHYLLKLDQNGVLDSAFNPGFNNPVTSLLIQADGGILCGGLFTTVGNGRIGIIRNRMARITPDGLLDPTFDPNANGTVETMALQADGKILIGGVFTTLDGVAHNHLARLNPDGRADATFSATANGIVYSLSLEADGSILVGGSFTTVNGVPRNHLARLNNGPGTQALSVPYTDRVLWTHSGTAPDFTTVQFESSPNEINWTVLGNGIRVPGTSNWQLKGLSLPTIGRVRARGHTVGGYECASSGLIEETASYSATAAPILPALVLTTQPCYLGTTCATLCSLVSSPNSLATLIFQYGPNPTFGLGTTNVQVPGGIPSGETSVQLGILVQGLAPHTTYYCRAIATNPAGTTTGNSVTFLTLAETPDSDGDGVPDLIEFALGGDISSQANPSHLTTGTILLGGNFVPTASYTPLKGNSGLHYSIETSPNLQLWTTSILDTISTVDNPDGITQTVTLKPTNAMLSTFPKLYLRLRVTQ